MILIDSIVVPTALLQSKGMCAFLVSVSGDDKSEDLKILIGFVDKTESVVELAIEEQHKVHLHKN